MIQKRPVPLDGAVVVFSAGFGPKRLTGSVVAGSDPNNPPAGLSEVVSAGFEPKRLTVGFGASELGFEPNNPPPDGASAFS